MNNVGDILEVYRRKVNDLLEVNSLIRGVMKQIANVSIKSNDIKVKDGVLKIKTVGSKKLLILLNKTEILRQLQEKIPKIKITEII